MKIAIGNDHAGPAYKEAIINLLKSKGITVTNYGTDTEESVDWDIFCSIADCVATVNPKLYRLQQLTGDL